MRRKQGGFTIVELLVAMAFFSFLLMLVTFGFVQINRSYTRGITVKTIQETTRGVLEDLTRALRTTEEFDFLTPSSTGGGYRLCISELRYAWNQQDKDESETDFKPTREDFANTADGEITMVRANDGLDCADPVDKDNAEIILDDRAAIQDLSVISIGNDSYLLSIVVSTKKAAENDLDIYGLNARCKVQIGDQFCDVADLTTVVQTRN